MTRHHKLVFGMAIVGMVWIASVGYYSFSEPAPFTRIQPGMTYNEVCEVMSDYQMLGITLAK